MDQATIQQLLRPEAFPHPAPDPVLLETHISWVILAGDFAYKIKKPVDLGFLDFSSLALRRHYCEQELALNRRFAPELYLAVVTVTGGDDGPRLGDPGPGDPGPGDPGPGDPGPGNPGGREAAGTRPLLDHAVKMRRFDQSQLLAEVAARGGLDQPLVRDLARELARLHGQLPVCRPDPRGEEAGTPAVLHAALEQNFQQIGGYPLAPARRQQLEAVRQRALARFRELLPVMMERVREGRVIDGHGDDHLGNIAVIDGRVRLFDCIEFNPGFRIVDSIAELALLSMDIEARGFPEQAARLLTDYLEYRGDYPGLALLDLYRCYFALVRAKVNLLREAADDPGLMDTPAWSDACHYLDLARRYSQPRQRFLVITHGVSGSGKSTVAGALLDASGAVRLRSDVERKRLYGLAPEESSPPGERSQLYSRAASARTFERLETLAGQVLAAGFPVIVDATFLHRRLRARFRELAAASGVPFAVLACTAEPGELRRRLRQRAAGGGDASEADVAVMEQQLASMQPPGPDELPQVVAVDAGWSGAALRARLQALWR